MKRKGDGNGCSSGRWSSEEHKKFINAIDSFGKDWKKISEKVETRTVAQIRSHAQKFFAKEQRNQIETIKCEQKNEKSDDVAHNDHPFVLFNRPENPVEITISDEVKKVVVHRIGSGETTIRMAKKTKQRNNEIVWEPIDVFELTRLEFSAFADSKADSLAFHLNETQPAISHPRYIHSI